jgi:cytochrome P450
MGQRRCIGEFFAMVEMQIHLGTVAKRLRLRHVPERPVELEPHINLRTKHNLYMIAEKR